MLLHTVHDSRGKLFLLRKVIVILTLKINTARIHIYLLLTLGVRLRIAWHFEKLLATFIYFPLLLHAFS